MTLRLLPWTDPNGKPSYLLADNRSSYLSRLADHIEATQLLAAEDLLDYMAKALSAGTVSEFELRLMVSRLTHALHDTLRIAVSRGGRDAAPADIEDLHDSDDPDVVDGLGDPDALDDVGDEDDLDDVDDLDLDDLAEAEDAGHVGEDAGPDSDTDGGVPRIAGLADTAGIGGAGGAVGTAQGGRFGAGGPPPSRGSGPPPSRGALRADAVHEIVG